ncbi:MAG TPA: HAD family hydrolase [Nannocystaceae bacterium]|nr:HAD family hydrolase [Nannocystaceae bacterium]
MSRATAIAAFFDIDHTVLEINSGSKWISYLWKSGQMSTFMLMRSLTWLVEYRFGLLDFEAMAKRVLASYKGRPIDPILEEIEQWFERDVAWSICVQARERVAEHTAEGHVVALLTSATQFLAHAVARTLSIEHILCTEVEVEDGLVTGRHVAPACYGPGKVVRAELWAEQHGVDLDASYFYTDSYSDLPMLERVGLPRVVNPDPRLRRKANERGWGYETWTAPPRSIRPAGP